MMEAPPLYTYYGDDFTGSTDVLEQLALGGVEAALFLTPPTRAQITRFPGLRGFGVAGDARAQSPAWMSEHLTKVFQALREYGAPVVHYKVCSTFDSSPQTGSIGCAIDLGLQSFDSEFVPIVVAAPHLRRYVLDGKLYAAAPDGIVHRIDRHPMSRHPVTPMREPDLVRHLAAQTREHVGLVRHDELATRDQAQASVDLLLASGTRVILFDSVDAASLEIVGEIVWEKAQKRQTFSAASSGLTTALLHAWRTNTLLQPSPMPRDVPATSPLLVVSGSCSAATALQIEWAMAHGFHAIRIHPTEWLGENSSTFQAKIVSEAEKELNAGRDVLLYTAQGESRTRLDGKELGVSLGKTAQELLRRTRLQRIVFCGGDTSSYAVQQLGVEALTWLASLDPGAPLCLAHRDVGSTHRLELVLKGGQVGAPDFFAKARGSQSSTAAPGIACETFTQAKSKAASSTAPEMHRSGSS